jgi:hypothetical protein
MATKKKAKKKASPKPKAKAKPAPKRAAAVKKGPRQAALPGMEDRGIQAIDDAALSYVEVRDQRIALQTGEGGETELKKKLMDLMHKSGKKSYKHGNISIEIVPEGEKIKVKVKAESTSDEPGDPGQSIEEEEPDETEPPIDDDFVDDGTTEEMEEE